MRAASMSSSGTVLKYWRNMKVPVAVMIDGTMMPASVSYRPRSRITTNVEGMITSVGSIVVARMHTKNTLSHHALYLANA